MTELHAGPAGRDCDVCTLCCKVMNVPELDKPAGVWCRDCVIGQGCGRYDTRPSICRSFHCAFLQDPALDERWRPSVARFVLVVLAPEERATVYVDQQRPDAWRREPYLSTFRRWAKTAIERVGLIDVNVGGRTIVVLPDRDVDLGVIAPDEKVAAYAEQTPQGVRYNAVKVKNKAQPGPAAPAIAIWRTP